MKALRLSLSTIALMTLMGCGSEVSTDGGSGVMTAAATSLEPERAAHVVEFRIAQGTGTNSWNTEETKVEVKVGDILRIINDDDVVHRLHTDEDRPCAH